MKPKLTLDQAKGMTWGEVFSYYFPHPIPAPSEIDAVLWNETYYPFDTEKTLDQLYEYYIKTIKS